MNNIIGYYSDKDADKDKPLSPDSVFVAIDEPWDYTGKYITAYCPIGQHGALDRDYLKECSKITREQYIQASKGFYTPEEYLG
jgi:hypothetical protein